MLYIFTFVYDKSINKCKRITCKYKSNFYLETKIEYEKEMKVYFVQNELFFYDNEKNIDVNPVTGLYNSNLTCEKFVIKLNAGS